MNFRIAQKTLKKAEVQQTGDDAVKLQLPGSKFIFSQASIVSSVQTEDNSPYLIKPDTAKFINQNGDGWSNASLKANYPSFVGAFNFVNHVQEPDKAVGFLADVALRRLLLKPEENEYVFYADILVATSRVAHPDLCQKILSGRIEYLSMGCESFLSTCSACGKEAPDEMDFCQHLLYQKGKFFIDRFGVKRKTAELLGTDQPGSCEFYEASWLTEVPAFGGAVKRNILSIGTDQTVTVEMPRKAAMKPAVQMFIDL